MLALIFGLRDKKTSRESSLKVLRNLRGYAK
jgi:hypothetical protein